MVMRPSLITLQANEQFIHLTLPETYQILSSAELNGGMTTTQHLLNLKVSDCPYDDPSLTHTPEESLLHFAKQLGLPSSTIGMMTAASMHSLRILSDTLEETCITVALTCGLSNARRAGDTADISALFPSHASHGTINIFVMIDTPLHAKAMVEALSLVAEAKAATLQDLNIKSSISNGIATGTGTDSTAIACAIHQKNTPQIQYCGKHMKLGEMIAHLVSSALSSSIQRHVLGTPQ